MNNLKASFIVGHYTFKELLGSKVLLNVVFLAFGLSLLSYLGHELAYGASAKVSLDIGLGVNYFSLVIISLFLGASLISKEIENRTLYLSLSRPIGRFYFLFGKLMGMGLMLLLNSIILSSAILLIFSILGGELNSLIIWSLILDFFSALIVLHIVIFFSLFTNQVISVIFTIVAVLAGNFLHQLALLNFVIKRKLLSIVVSGLKWLLPNLDMLNIKDFVLYYDQIPSRFLYMALAYAMLYILFLLIFSVVIFQRKDLD